MKSDRGLSPPNALSEADIVSSAAGKRQTKSRCMPGYWAPCPGNNTASFSGAPEAKKIPSGVVQVPEAFWESRFERAESIMLAASCLPRSSTKVSRAASEALKAARERMAFTRSPSQSRPFQEVNSRLRVSAPAPDKAAICTSPSQSGCCFSEVYSSSTAWKLAPPKPSALTPARRGWSFLIHGRSSVFR